MDSFRERIQVQKKRLIHLQMDTPEKQIDHVLCKIEKAVRLSFTTSFPLIGDTIEQLQKMGLVITFSGAKSGEEMLYEFKFL